MRYRAFGRTGMLCSQMALGVSLFGRSGYHVPAEEARKILDGYLQLEDQDYPKRCGHFGGKSVISAAEMVDKIQAAREARADPRLLIIARTDARAEHGPGEACRRALAYHEAGADILFVEAPETVGEVELIARELPGPLVHNVVEGGVTPEVPLPRLAELGYSIALFANLSLLAGIWATREVLAFLRRGWEGPRPRLATWTERQNLVRKPWFDAFADRFDSAPPVADARSHQLARTRAQEECRR